MNEKENVSDTVEALVEKGIFGLLAVKPVEGDVVLRPIGGRWDSGIIDAIQEMADKYPGCKMRLFDQESNFDKYFKGIVSKDQVQPYADLSPQAKAAIEEVRRKVFSPPWKVNEDSKLERQVNYKNY
jgi:hypothetical protein